MAKIKIRDKNNYKKFLKILGELDMDNKDNSDNRYEYGKNYEQYKDAVIKVKKSDFEDIFDYNNSIIGKAQKGIENLLK
jgi:phage terminase small subunit